MISFFVWTSLAVAVCIVDRANNRFLFTLASFALLTILLLLPLGTPVLANILAAIIAITIAAASRIKYHHSGLQLLAADLALTFAGTIPFMLTQYRRTAILSLAGLAALILAALAAFTWIDEQPRPVTERLFAFVPALIVYALAFRFRGGSSQIRHCSTTGQNHFANFLASIFDIKSWWRPAGLQFTDSASPPLQLSAAIPGKTKDLPDIIVIQHESVFDPRLYGLSVEPRIARFLQPPGSLHGPAHVEIFGGGSWQTEFSFLTGLASRSFGPDAYFIFRKGAGRFRHSLPFSLRSLGYQTLLAAGCARRFLNYDSFYTSIGVDERCFEEDFPAPFDAAEFRKTSSDALFLDAARRQLEGSIARDAGPKFLMVLTNFNHGPHNQRHVAAGTFEREREAAFLSLPDPEYAEYMARLSETAASWETFKSTLAEKCPGRPMLIVRYGDHQPVMSRRLETALRLKPGPSRAFTTFYCIEALNMPLTPTIITHGQTLDIAFLGTVALQAAGLPLDTISATRASLIAECGSDYFAAPSERKLRFHRALVEQGAVQCGGR